jgi:argininosuccinate lyase
VPRSLELAGKVTRLMTGVVSTLRVNPERMWEALCSGFSQATDLAEYVMQTREIDYRSAYLLVGEAVRKASREGLRGVDITGEMLDEAAVGTIGRSLGLTGRDLSQVLDPRAIVLTRTSVGGAAPEVVRRMAADQAAEASAARDRASKALGSLDAAESALISAAEEVARRRG